MTLSGGASLESSIAAQPLELYVDGNLLLAGGSELRAQGHASELGPGAGAPSFGFSGSGGAGHGAVGGDGTGPSAGSGGPVYGVNHEPVAPGSGASSVAGRPEGAGGGAFRLDVAGDLQLDGRVAAHGSPGPFDGTYGPGGGSGGSIWITARSGSGSGSLLARGADGGAPPSGYGGGGGGCLGTGTFPR